MSKEEIIETTSVEAEQPKNPFAVSKPQTEHINEGTVAVESSRAVAEAQGKLIIAKQFPRDEIQAYDRAMQACKRKELAEKALYSYPRSGSTVEGASIRLAEELARCWGNIDFGIKELSQKTGESEMLAYCWDMETNTMSSQQFVVPHIRETQKGAVPLKNSRDIYENNANMAGRRLRARILAVLPPDLVNDAIAECKKTIAGRNDTPLIDRIKKMVTLFAKLGVRQETIEKRLGRPIEDMTPDDLAEYVAIYNSLKDGIHSVSEWFDIKTNADKTQEMNDTLLKGGKK